MQCLCAGGRAIVVEVCRRADQLANELAAGEQWQRQLAALEALQIYAPMGHALGLQALCSGLEDRCFQVGSRCAALDLLLFGAPRAFCT